MLGARTLALGLSMVLFGACGEGAGPIDASGRDGGSDDGGAPDAEIERPLTVQFTAATCPFKAPAGVDVRCHTLGVPEDYDAPEPRLIKLAVAHYKSKSKTPAKDPVVYLAGGPGN